MSSSSTTHDSLFNVNKLYDIKNTYIGIPQKTRIMYSDKLKPIIIKLRYYIFPHWPTSVSSTYLYFYYHCFSLSLSIHSHSPLRLEPLPPLRDFVPLPRFRTLLTTLEKKHTFTHTHFIHQGQ